MIICYLNYPNTQMNIHRPTCNHISKHGGGRVKKINATNISNVLHDFQAKKVDFKAQKGFNDMTLEIDFESDEEFEVAVFKYITNLLGKRYTAFTGRSHKCRCISLSKAPKVVAIP